MAVFFEEPGINDNALVVFLTIRLNHEQLLLRPGDLVGAAAPAMMKGLVLSSCISEWV